MCDVLYFPLTACESENNQTVNHNPAPKANLSNKRACRTHARKDRANWPFCFEVAILVQSRKTSGSHDRNVGKIQRPLPVSRSNMKVAGIFITRRPTKKKSEEVMPEKTGIFNNHIACFSNIVREETTKKFQENNAEKDALKLLYWSELSHSDCYQIRSTNRQTDISKLPTILIFLIAYAWSMVAKLDDVPWNTKLLICIVCDLHTTMQKKKQQQQKTNKIADSRSWHPHTHFCYFELSLSAVCLSLGC